MQGFSEKMQGPGQLIFLRPLKKKKKKIDKYTVEIVQEK